MQPHVNADANANPIFKASAPNANPIGKNPKPMHGRTKYAAGHSEQKERKLM